MAERKDEILNFIVEEFIKTATPVCSSLIVDKYFKDLSSATVRNDMVLLEEMGLIFQPHTSAGRIPTIEGYKSYLNEIQGREWTLNIKSKKIIDSINLTKSEQDIKSMAKALAEISDSAVLIGFSPHNVYYTGISNIFRQPEFRDQTLIYSISEVIDHLDEVMQMIYLKIGEEIKIIIGDENPFGELTSVILSKVNIENKEIMVGILGPNRMDYRENISLIKYIQQIKK